MYLIIELKTLFHNNNNNNQICMETIFRRKIISHNHGWLPHKVMHQALNPLDCCIHVTAFTVPGFVDVDQSGQSDRELVRRAAHLLPIVPS